MYIYIYIVYIFVENGLVNKNARAETFVKINNNGLPSTVMEVKSTFIWAFLIKDVINITVAVYIKAEIRISQPADLFSKRICNLGILGEEIFLGAGVTTDTSPRTCHAL